MNVKPLDLRAMHLGYLVGAVPLDAYANSYNDMRTTILEILGVLDVDVEVPEERTEFVNTNEQIEQNISIALAVKRAELGGPVYALPFFKLAYNLIWAMTGIALGLEWGGFRDQIVVLLDDMGVDEDLIDILYEEAAWLQVETNGDNQNVYIKDLLEAGLSFQNQLFGELHKIGALADDTYSPVGDLEKKSQTLGAVAYNLVSCGFADRVRENLQKETAKEKALQLTTKHPITFARKWYRWRGHGPTKSKDDELLWHAFEATEGSPGEVNNIELRQFDETPHRIVLIHGIRTVGTWQARVKDQLEGIPGVKVEKVGYPWLDGVRFWIPWLRDKPITTLSVRLRDAIKKAKTDDPRTVISVVAHSFGSHGFTKILRENQDIVVHRVVLCGSIVPTIFPWHKCADQISGGVVNEIGTKDIWPALAESMTWGFGSSGIQGFRDSRVTDRYHPISHSGFFDSEIVRRHWLPWFLSGEVVDVEPSDLGPNYLFVLLSKLPIRWGIVGLLIFAPAFLAYEFFI